MPRRSGQRGGRAAAAYLDAPSHAWSVARRLVPTYGGALIRVRRSSDNAEADIGQAGELLDEAALATHLGADSGYLVTVYDQGVDTAADLTQTTTTAQYRIANAGVIERLGAGLRPAGTIYQASQGMRFTLGGAVAIDTATFYHVGLGSSAVSAGARLFSVLSGAAADGSASGNIAAVLMNSASGSNDKLRSIRSGTTTVSVTVPPAAVNAYCVTADGSWLTIEAGLTAAHAETTYTSTSTGNFTFDRGGWSVTGAATFSSHIGCFAGESAYWLTGLAPSARAALMAGARQFWGF